jgi:hypothetical protein
VGGPRPRRPSRPSGPTYKTLDERWGRPTEAEERFERGRRTIGLFLGPLVFVVLLALPFDLEGKQQALAGDPGPGGRLVDHRWTLPGLVGLVLGDDSKLYESLSDRWLDEATASAAIVVPIAIAISNAVQVDRVYRRRMQRQPFARPGTLARRPRRPRDPSIPDTWPVF